MDASHAISCEFDRLFNRNVPHILEKIFFSLDLASFKSCKNVSSWWNELFMTESYCEKASQLTLEMKQNQMKLLEAIEKGRFKEYSEESIREVQRLLSLGVNPDGDDNASPLCEHRPPKSIYQMIMRSAKVKTPLCEHTIPLCLAAKMGAKDVVEMLLNHGADLDKTDKAGCSPLDLAAFNRRKTTSLFLIKRGANVNKGGEYDENLLTWAVETSDISNVKDALKVCAKPSTRLDWGITALSEAIKFGFYDAFQLIIDRGASLQHLLNGGRIEGNPILVHVLKLMFKCTYKNGHESDRYKTLLKIAQAVLDAGADPNVSDTYGNHLVSLAVHNRNIGLIKLLLNKGADPKMVNLAGSRDSLLDWARMPDKDIIMLLISNGADPNKVGLWGTTPLIILSGRADVVLNKGGRHLRRSKEIFIKS